MNEFWRKWHRPVHDYLVCELPLAAPPTTDTFATATLQRRYVHKPLRAAGYSRMMGATAVFFVSALLHEVILSLSTLSMRWDAFGAMFVQVRVASRACRCARLKSLTLRHAAPLGVRCEGTASANHGMDRGPVAPLWQRSGLVQLVDWAGARAVPVLFVPRARALVSCAMLLLRSLLRPGPHVRA